jgi:hypothetical protein
MPIQVFIARNNSNFHQLTYYRVYDKLFVCGVFLDQGLIAGRIGPLGEAAHLRRGVQPKDIARNYTVAVQKEGAPSSKRS